jgi:hypothetical protein
MNLRILVVLAGVLAAPFMSIESAHALKNFTIPATTTSTYVGMVNGNAWAAHLRPLGCLWTRLGTGGLDDTTYLNGLNTDDRIYAVSTATQVCNAPMTSLVTAGHSIYFLGSGGNDILVGFIKAANRGGDGNDIMWSDLPGTIDRGGAGNDTLFSDTTTARLYGEGGDDSLCNMYPGEHVHVQRMDGGAHASGDAQCGLAHDSVGIEFRNVSPQCPARCSVF